ncbi:hypothetical protein [Streptomyces sp. NPDC058466]|uniref:hypothetical protein n=1 Tax=Streptomyces sp. NPDC058466 TaxID=3346512 RepID=UPI0036608810
MAEYAGNAAADALLAAITDEPLPEGAHEDAAFMAEHRSAMADVALLRRQLTAIGNTLADDEVRQDITARQDTRDRQHDSERQDGSEHQGSRKPAAVAKPQLEPQLEPKPKLEPKPPRPPSRRRRRPFAIALGGLAATAALSTVVGLGWLVSHNGGGADSASKSSGGSAADSATGAGGAPSDPAGELACSRLVVEGTVARVQVDKATAPRFTVVLTVTRYFVPDHGPSQVTFLLSGGAEPSPHPGDHVLIRIPRGADGPTLWAVGDPLVATNRAWITKALPQARTTQCEQQ